MSQDKNPDRLELTQYSFVSIILAVQDAVQKGYKIHEDTNEFYPKQYGACYIVHMDKVPDMVLSEDKVTDKVLSEDNPDTQQKSIEETVQSTVVSSDTSVPAKEPATQVDQSTPESSEKATKPAKAIESAKVQVQRKK